MFWFSCTSLSVRLAVLVILAVLPTCAFILWNNLQNTQADNCTGLALLATASIAFVWLGSEFLLLRWVRVLTQISQQLAAGDLKVPINDLRSAPTEIKQLAQTFEQMAVSSQQQFTALQQLNDTLEQQVRERTAQLEATNRELDAFAYSVSHDLRAPLRHIKGFVDALALELQTSGAIANPKTDRYVEVIQDSCLKMGLLIDGLLKLSRVGRQQLANRPVDLRQLVDAAIALVTSLSTTDDNRFMEFIVGELPIVNGDSALLQQVFSNLIDNAVKFSCVRQIVKIEVGILSDSTIFVKDNGVGFSMEYADQLFGAFQRLHSQREFKGTGIGLAIVQRIIHRHGGIIWAESAPDRGATFYFKLKQMPEG